MFDVKAAQEELEQKTIYDIQEETAYKWASRALAALAKYNEHLDPRWAFDAREYYHEAIEHAALCESRVLAAVIEQGIAEKLDTVESGIARTCNG